MIQVKTINSWTASSRLSRLPLPWVLPRVGPNVALPLDLWAAVVKVVVENQMVMMESLRRAVEHKVVRCPMVVVVARMVVCQEVAKEGVVLRKVALLLDLWAVVVVVGKVIVGKVVVEDPVVVCPMVVVDRMVMDQEVGQVVRKGVKCQICRMEKMLREVVMGSAVVIVVVVLVCQVAVHPMGKKIVVVVLAAVGLAVFQAWMLMLLPPLPVMAVVPPPTLAAAVLF